MGLGKLKSNKSEEPRLRKNSVRYPIWSAECPSCKVGIVLLFEKGGSGKCNKCKRLFFTDYEEHPELGTPQTEYWLVD
jgi:hypothetical protein